MVKYSTNTLNEVCILNNLSKDELNYLTIVNCIDEIIQCNFSKCIGL